MRVVLQVSDGPDAGKTIEMRPGRIAQVGRSSWADLPVAGDPALADIHFLLECGTSSCRLRDLNSPGGTFHNGRRVSQAALGDGDVIRAGQTSFVVQLGAAAVGARAPAPMTTAGLSPAPGPEETGREASQAIGVPLPQVLRSQEEPLFALLDAARDLRVLVLLHESGEEFQSLYEGPKGEQLGLVAPYLVRLPAASPLLETLVGEGWGRSWGVYLTSRSPFGDVRKHLRRFLVVQTDDGKKLYFRFYDPRVLRDYLTTCTGPEAHEFFGPVESYLVEDADPATLLSFAGPDSDQAIRPRSIPLLSLPKGHPAAPRGGRSS
jgi:hypothetical protein